MKKKLLATLFVLVALCGCDDSPLSTAALRSPEERGVSLKAEKEPARPAPVVAPPAPKTVQEILPSDAVITTDGDRFSWKSELANASQAGLSFATPREAAEDAAKWEKWYWGEHKSEIEKHLEAARAFVPMPLPDRPLPQTPTHETFRNELILPQGATVSISAGGTTYSFSAGAHLFFYGP